MRRSAASEGRGTSEGETEAESAGGGSPAVDEHYGVTHYHFDMLNAWRAATFLQVQSEGGAELKAATAAQLNCKFAADGDAFKGEMGFGGTEEFPSFAIVGRTRIGHIRLHNRLEMK